MPTKPPPPKRLTYRLAADCPICDQPVEVERDQGAGEEHHMVKAWLEDLLVAELAKHIEEAHDDPPT